LFGHRISRTTGPADGKAPAFSGQRFQAQPDRLKESCSAETRRRLIGKARRVTGEAVCCSAPPSSSSGAWHEHRPIRRWSGETRKSLWFVLLAAGHEALAPRLGGTGFACYSCIKCLHPPLPNSFVSLSLNPVNPSGSSSRRIMSPRSRSARTFRRFQTRQPCSIAESGTSSGVLETVTTK